LEIGLGYFPTWDAILFVQVANGLELPKLRDRRSSFPIEVGDPRTLYTLERPSEHEAVFVQ